MPDSNQLSTMLNRELIHCDNTVSREQLLKLETSCKEQPQVEVPVEHFFAGGVYGRQVTIPANSLLVGKIHKHEQINVLLRGVIDVATEDGVVRLTAPHTFISPAGVKRAGWTVTETVWLTFHGTESRDLTEIEDAFISTSYEDYDKFKLGVKHELGSNSNSGNSRLGCLPAKDEPKSPEEG